MRSDGVSGYKGDFYKDLAQWVKGMCTAEQAKRDYEEGLRSREYSIRWYEAEIGKLATLLQRKPRVIRQIREYKYCIRQLELEIAFMGAAAEYLGNAKGDVG